jgi:simple sugar transport system ATP-binding protein
VSLAPAVDLRGIVKRFGATVANRGARLTVAPGEVHALVGENGAGKSTLMRILAGLHAPDAGEIRIRGRLMERNSPEAAMAQGVGMVHQHFMLIPALTVAENIVLGREPRRGPRLDLARAEREIQELSARYGLAVDPRRRVSELSVGEEQRVEIVKVLYRNADLLVLDEPTAVLTPGEVGELFRVVRGLVAGGKTAILITHKLDEVMAVSQRVTVMRRGETVAERVTAETSAAELARDMVGHELAAPRARAARPVAGEAAPALELRGVSVRRGRVRKLEDVSLLVRPGEIVGVAGVEGNGQAELVEAVVGLAPLERGTVTLGGRDVGRLSVRQRLRLGLGYLPEDRQRRGLVLDLDVTDNCLLGRLDRFARWRGCGPLDRAPLRATAADLVARFDIRPADPEALARHLSGGNQQKLVVARVLGPDLRVLVAAQPTRGVDVAAVERIHEELRAARDRGVAVLLLSADLEELSALCDRIAVLYRGRIAAVVEATVSHADLGALMTGAAGT